MTSTRRHGLHATLNRIRRDEAGNIVLMFAVLLVPLAAVSIGALDYGRSNGVRRELQTALDAGLSFAAPHINAEDGSAELAFRRAFKSNLAPELQDTPVSFAMDRTQRRLTAEAKTNVPVHVIGILSGNQIEVVATAELGAADVFASADRRKGSMADATGRNHDAEARARAALGRILQPSDTATDPLQIDPAEVERLAREILRQLGQ